MKKMVALALCASMMFSTTVLADETSGVDYYGFEEPVTVKIGLGSLSEFTYPEGTDATHNVWYDLYKEHNILLDVLYEVNHSQEETKFSAALMSGDYPDVFYVSASEYLNYVNNGVVADITDLYEQYASDDLKEYVAADGGTAMEKATVDGKLYGIPYMSDYGYDLVPLLFIRQDWLDNLGLKAPTNLEEFKDVAHAFTYEDPDKDGKDNTYGFAVNGVDVLTGGMGSLNGFFQGFGVYMGTDGMNFMYDENGEVEWGGDKAEEVKAALTTLQEMYQDGTISKEFITMDSDSVNEDAGAGNVGMWIAPIWGAMGPISNIIKGNPDGHVTAVPIPDFSGKGDNKVLQENTINQYCCVSSQCENPEVLFKILNLDLQKLFSSNDAEEYQTYCNDVTWKMSVFRTMKPAKNYDNYLKGVVALETGDTSELNVEQINNHNNMKAYLDAKESGDMDPEAPEISTGAQLYTVFGDPQGSYAAIDQLVQNDNFIISCYQGPYTDVMAETSSVLRKLTVETIVKIITGDSMDTYDTFLENWHLMGGDDAIAEAQSWIDSNK